MLSPCLRSGDAQTSRSLIVHGQFCGLCHHLSFVRVIGLSFACRTLKRAMSFFPFFDPGGAAYLPKHYPTSTLRQPRPHDAHITHQRGLFGRLRLTLGDLLGTIDGGTNVKLSRGHTARLESELIRSFESPSHDFLTGHCAPFRRVDLAAKIFNVTAGVILTGIQYHLGIARTSPASRRFVWTSFAALNDALSGQTMAHERRTRACQPHIHGALFSTCHGGCIVPSSHY